MAHEIERKFRVAPGFRPDGEGVRLEQGYLSSVPERTVRVRIEGTAAKITIKGVTTGVTRLEYEYAIPFDDAAAMLRDLCEKPHIAKRRHAIAYAGKTWEVDVFEGDNAGLVIAEIELTSEAEPFARPPWVTTEVSDDPRYFNSNLVRAPYKTWSP
jgi:adenylate cyclase